MNISSYGMQHSSGGSLNGYKWLPALQSDRSWRGDLQRKGLEFQRMLPGVGMCLMTDSSVNVGSGA